MLSVRALSRPGLEPASFDLAAGEGVAVRGGSGSGKSLLLRAIADLDPNHGRLSLDGRARESMSGPEWRRLVIYVPAEPGWWAETVGGHFTDWDAAAPLAAALGLAAGCRDWPVSRLSTGERQRLALVRALVRQPRVLLLDEPTSGLDHVTAAAAETLVARHREAGGATLWVTHDPAQAARIASRLLMVEAGRVCEQKPSPAAREQNPSPATREQEPGPAAREQK